MLRHFALKSSTLAWRGGNRAVKRAGVRGIKVSQGLSTSSRFGRNALCAGICAGQQKKPNGEISWKGVLGVASVAFAATSYSSGAAAEDQSVPAQPKADQALSTVPPPSPRKPISRRKLARRNSQRKQKRHYSYVIIGGGTTSYAAIEAVRQIHPEADVLIISEEPSLPRADVDDESEFFECGSLLSVYNEYRRHISSRLENEPDAYSARPITLLLGRRRLRIDAESRTVHLHDGTTVSYDKCLLASAGEPREFYVLDSNQIPFSLRNKINTLTKLQNFIELDVALKNEEVEHLTVIGGGFMGTELACSIADHAKDHTKVSHVMVESGVLQRYLPKYLSKYVTKKMTLAGVNVVTDRLVTGLSKPVAPSAKAGEPEAEASDRSVSVQISGYETENLETDYVVLASTHITPNTRVGEESGLEIDSKHGGIVVNGAFEASNGLYVAGNLASYYDPAVGRRRVDRYDHAVNSGLLAGQNMAMGRMPNNKQQSFYRHQPVFKSELRGLGVQCEGVGIIDSNLQTVGVWLANRDEETNEVLPRTLESDFQRGVVYYIRDNTVVGVLLWNAPEQLQKAREIINLQKSIRNEEDLRTTILLGPEEWTDLVIA